MNATKRLSWQIGAIILLVLAALGTSLQAAPDPVDPIVGDWFWHQDHPATFKADGTVSRKDGKKGTWEYLFNPEVQRHYRVVWQNGQYVDTLVLKEDGQHAHVHGSGGHQYEVRRALPDKPTDSPNKSGSYFGTLKP